MKLYAFAMSFLLFASLCFPNSYAGKTLEEALREIQMKGVKLLFSSDLVRPELKVSTEPKSDSPQQILQELLIPHGLNVQNGPAKTLLVVRKFASASPVTNQHRKIIVEQPAIEPAEENVIVPFVTVYVTAESHTRVLTNLRPDDFVVKEDGKEQQIVEFQNLAEQKETVDIVKEWEQPLRIVFLMDSSSSMNRLQDGVSRHERVKLAGMNLVERLAPQDGILLMGFNSENWIISEMSVDLQSVQQTLAQQQVKGGKTSLFDAMMTALESLQRYPGRRMIVLCSDGEDTSSRTKLDELILSLQSSDVPVFSVAIELKRRMTPVGLDTLKAISAATGGKFLIPSGPEDLDTTMDQILKAIRSQYLIGYRPLNSSIHGWRQINIHCKRPFVRLHYRKSYLM
ncbi:VWA domain-containing protein [bacterium]|nr:VWA domain-containing protein [bacterium]